LNSYLSILKIVLHGRGGVKILLATLASFAFSISVILCTFGLMDGFDHLLKSGLRHSSGDLLITSQRGFFILGDRLKKEIETIEPKAIASVIQTEAFALHADRSRGVLVRGIDEESFSLATGLRLKMAPGGMAIGSVLAKDLNLKVGDFLALTLGRGNDSSEGLPSVKQFRVDQIVSHGIYQKDLRFVYMPRMDLADLLSVGDKINLVIVAVESAAVALKDLAPIEEARQKLRYEMSSEFLIKPFWGEYAFLIEAVKVEKFSISLILQLIVVVAVFNIMAFVIYIMEKKAQDFFFLRAVGLSLGSLMKFWLISIILIWAVSCTLAHFLSEIFNWSLHNLSFLQIPGEIYVLSSLNVRLNATAYVTVYFVSLIWVMIASFGGYWRLRRRPIIQGLRQEFS
jgi:ABC-type lipoprotein release transport system permease subunit